MHTYNATYIMRRKAIVQFIAVFWRHDNKLYIKRESLCVTYVYI